MNKTKLSVLATLVAATAVPAIAAADHDRARHDARYDDRSYAAWTTIGDVGTHAHDAEDYVPVSTAQRLQQIELTAHGRPVRLDDVKFQMADGRILDADVDLTLHDNQRIVLDVPEQGRVKMLVLEYANHGPFYRGREESRIEVRALGARDWKNSVRDRRHDAPAYAPGYAPAYEPSYTRTRTIVPSVEFRAGARFRGSY